MFHTNLKQISVCIVHKLSLDECPRQKRAISRILNKLQLKCGKIMKFRETFLNFLKIAARKLYFQRLVYGRIFVGFGWEVDGQRGQYRLFLTCLTVFSWDTLQLLNFDLTYYNGLFVGRMRGGEIEDICFTLFRFRILRDHPTRTTRWV